MVVKEIWKPIAGYETYEISNTGKVKSLKRNVVLKPQTNASCGMLQVMLWRKSHAKLHYIHRLVAQAFVENPHGYNYVKHRDRDYNNNNANNLYWAKQINPKTKA